MFKRLATFDGKPKEFKDWSFKFKVTSKPKCKELVAGPGDDLKNLWIGFGTLPTFMDVRKYGGAGGGR